MSVRFRWSASNIVLAAENQWQPGLRSHDANTSSKAVLDAPEIQSSLMVDADRSWANSTEDVEITFSEAVSDASLSIGGTATGYSIVVNGVAQTTTYRSGSGTNNWVLRAATLVKNGDVVGVTYSKAIGNTTAVSDSVEIESIVASFVFNGLSKRIRFVLRGADNNTVNSETVKAAAHEYAGGIVASNSWMSLTDKASVLTDGSGNFDMTYTGVAPVGGNAYISVLRTAESFVWIATIT